VGVGLGGGVSVSGVFGWCVVYCLFVLGGCGFGVWGLIVGGCCYGVGELIVWCWVWW